MNRHSPGSIAGAGSPGREGPLNSSDERKREVEALRERISSLSGAVLRISASLDVGTVLRETVDSARALTGARYGAITTIDEAGRPQDFVTSASPPTSSGSWRPGPTRCASSSTCATCRGRSGCRTCRPTCARSAMPTSWPCRGPCRRRRCVTGACTSATSSSGRRRAGGSSRPTTRRSWCCSPRRPRTPSPTPARTATSGGRGPTSRPWWRPRRSASWCSTPGPAGRRR